ncbi:GntR family transcriptional regulator [Cochlodiniinecator piscidefendens]|uniref:GntR family transcriptional regulator n=1 Tax=Cochlodiniinecator piscidefendens TaxID=2715756 RepID=UPI00140D917F|nr:GntR family transcriptional regulator [Cochlodiniinecator piscidefendens]
MAPASGTPPRFRQIVDQLRQKIEEGSIKKHAALPSERIVAEEYSVSRMTARRALEALESEGLAYSEGRKGRFVSPQRLRYNISNMVSFASDLQASDADLEIDLLSKGAAKADSHLGNVLSVPVGTELWEYTRLFRIGGHPTFIETEYVVATDFPDLLDNDLRQSSTKLLEQKYNTSAHTGNILIRMRALTLPESEKLGTAPYNAGIELEQVISDAAGRAFCFGRQIWRGELAEFSAQAIVNPGKGR